MSHASQVTTPHPQSHKMFSLPPLTPQGPSPAGLSYANIDKILQAAQETKSDAVSASQ